jgi:putative FmdB family regulatory protein
MPIYEYHCRDCGKPSALLILNIRNPPPATCRQCGSAHMDRLLSRFAAPKSEEARLESLTDPSRLGGLDDQDPQSVARYMKTMGQELGEDIADVDALMETSEGGEGTDGIDSL